jgi:4-alpha-glucanotransferase
LGNSARMNFPGKAEGNWGWRYDATVLNEPIQLRLQSLTEICGRASS